MIEFKEKKFTEYDAMKSLYEEMKRYSRERRNFSFEVIDSTALIPILRGNNIVIERFVISTSFGRKDVYRMYLKFGARVKMPENLRLPSYNRRNDLFKLNLNIKNSIPFPGFNNNNNPKQTQSSESQYLENTGLIQKEFKGDKGPGGFFNPMIEMHPGFSYNTKELKGEVLKYSVKDRQAVIEFPDIRNAIESLEILPFGLNYKLYLLDV